MSIEFEENKDILKPMESKIKIPEKGLESWFHRHIPYGPNTTRFIMVLLILLMFLGSFFFFFAAIYNFQEANAFNGNFDERIRATKSN